MIKGALAGLAGVTALNIVSYLDMIQTGRPASKIPAQTVEKLADMAGIDIGSELAVKKKAARLQALGALSGIATGVLVGSFVGASSMLHSQNIFKTASQATVLAALLGEGIPVYLGLTDPKEWTDKEWRSAAYPHLAYGVVTALVLKKLKH